MEQPSFELCDVWYHAEKIMHYVDVLLVRCVNYVTSSFISEQTLNPSHIFFFGKNIAMCTSQNGYFSFIFIYMRSMSEVIITINIHNEVLIKIFEVGGKLNLVFFLSLYLFMNTIYDSRLKKVF